MKLKFCPVFALVAESLLAAPVTYDTASVIAVNFVRNNAIFRTAEKNFVLRDVIPYKTFWVAEFSPCGYMILSNDDDFPPVRMFSAEGNFIPELEKHPVIRSLERISKDMERKISKAASSSKSSGETGFKQQWDALRNKTVSAKDTITEERVGPLLTSTWGQGMYYNAMCPLRNDGGAGNGGHMVNGCVALAGAQLLRYHAWPPHGLSQKAHYAQNSDFTRPMCWPDMLDSYPESGMPRPWENIRAVAWLCMDVGSIVDMQYDNEGSSSDIFSLHSYLSKYFHYVETAHALQNSDPATLGEACAADLDQGNPVLARSVIYRDETQEDGEGHAWLVDGYYRDTVLGLMLHANYGWDGMGNDWFPPAAMYGYSELLGAITGLVPHPFPLFREPDGIQGPDFMLAWDVPRKYEGMYEAFRIKEGTVTTSTTLDFSSLAKWENSANYNWTELTGGGWEMTPGTLGGNLCLIDKFTAGTGAQLIITHRLGANTAVTPKVFIGEYSYSGTVNSFTALRTSSGFVTTTNLIPAAYLGQPINIELEIANNGGWSDPLDGVIQKIEVTNAEGIKWTLVSDAIPGTARSWSFSNVSSGPHLYCIESKRNGMWDVRGLSQPEKMSVTVAATAVTAPRLTVDETQCATPWKPDLQLHVSVDNPSGRPLTFRVEDTGCMFDDPWGGGDDPLVKPTDFSFRTLGGETFLVLPDLGRISVSNLTTWVKVSATTPEGAKGTTWFVLGQSSLASRVTVCSTKAAAFAAATASVPSKTVLLVALDESYSSATFPMAVNAGLNDRVNQQIIADNYILWRVDLSDTNTWTEVEKYYKTGLMVYAGAQFVCLVDPDNDTRLGDKYSNFYVDTFRDVIDPNGTLAARAALADVPQPSLTPLSLDASSRMSLLVSPVSPDGKYTVLSTDSLADGFHTTNTVRFAGETTNMTSFIAPRGATIIDVPLDDTDAARFFKIRVSPKQ